MKQGDIVCWQYEFMGWYHDSSVKANYWMHPTLICYWRIKTLKPAPTLHYKLKPNN